MATATEIFGRLDEGIVHVDVLGVPDAGARHFKQRAVFEVDILGVPQGVFPLEHGVVEGDVMAFFEGDSPSSKIESRISRCSALNKARSPLKILN